MSDKIEVTVEELLGALQAIGEEREKVVEELSYSAQIASLGDDAANTLREHLKELTLAYAKLLKQVETFEVNV